MKRLLTLFLFAWPAFAQTPIPVANSSFETPSGWTYVQGGTWAPPSLVYTSVPDGKAIGYANGGGSITQDLGVPATANGTYTLQLWVGHRLDGYATKATIQLIAGKVSLCSQVVDPSTIPAGTFAQQTLTCPAGPAPSGDLIISIASAGTQTDIDNVSLILGVLSPPPPPVTLTFAPSTSALMPCTDVVSYDDGSPLFPSPQTFTIMEQEGGAQVAIGTPTIGINGQVTGTVIVDPNYTVNGQVLLFATIGGIAGLPQIAAQPFDPRQLQQGSTGICMGVVLFKNITLPKYSVLGLTP